MNALKKAELDFNAAVERGFSDEKSLAYERLKFAELVADDARTETLDEVLSELRTQRSKIYLDGGGTGEAKRAALLQAVETIERLF